jgi:hypothetical protein
VRLGARLGGEITVLLQRGLIFFFIAWYGTSTRMTLDDTTSPCKCTHMLARTVSSGTPKGDAAYRLRKGARRSGAHLPNTVQGATQDGIVQRVATGDEGTWACVPQWGVGEKKPVLTGEHQEKRTNDDKGDGKDRCRTKGPLPFAT